MGAVAKLMDCDTRKRGVCAGLCALAIVHRKRCTYHLRCINLFVSKSFKTMDHVHFRTNAPHRKFCLPSHRQPLCVPPYTPRPLYFQLACAYPDLYSFVQPRLLPPRYADRSSLPAACCSSSCQAKPLVPSVVERPSRLPAYACVDTVQTLSVSTPVIQ
jgi:hypothetical protein